MKFKKFINKLDKLYMKGIKHKGSEPFCVNYLIHPDRNMSFSVANKVVTEMHEHVHISTGKERCKVYKRVKKLCKKGISTGQPVELQS